jgi:TolB-like protein/cytochrome c-type biogenesis protein CcmH/NrfG
MSRAPQQGHLIGLRGESMTATRAREQLERILESPGFDASARNRRFLEYIVEEALAGRADRLKGVTIAVDVFRRAATIDPQHDPVVRIEAAKLRRSLERYYLTAGQADPIRIDIPKGGYVPTFEARAQPLADLSPRPAAEQGATAAVVLAPGNPRARWPWRAAVGLAIVLGVMLAVVAATVRLWPARAPADQDDAQIATSLQLQGPAVIVAPFADLTGTESGRLFAGGLTQELVTNLMRFQDLRIYAARSNQQSNQDLGQQPDVRYMVEGSVGRTPARLHLVVHLIEVGSGRYLWSETFDRPLTTEDVFAVQEELSAELAGRLAEPYGVVHKVSADLFRRHRPQTLAAYECVLETFAYRRTFSRELYQSSRNCLEDTVRRDPTYPDGWAMLAYAHLDEYRWYGFGPLHGQPAALDQALAAAERAKELDPDNARSLSAYAAVQFYRGEFDEAESAQRRAVALNPNDPEALAQLGWRLAFARDWDQGIGLVRQAAQRSMVGFGWYYMILAFDDYRRGDYRAALADMDEAGELGFFAGPMVVAMCQAELGNAQDPTFAKDPRGAFRLHHLPEGLIDQFMAGLRKVGLDDPGA